MARVRVEAFVFCDAVVVDQRGKYSVQGIFDEVYCTLLPAVYEANFMIFGRLRLDQPGSIDAEIEIQTPSGRTHKEGPQRHSSGNSHVIALMIPGTRFPIPEAGRYVISLIIDGKKVSDFHVTATRSTAAAGGSSGGGSAQ